MPRIIQSNLKSCDNFLLKMIKVSILPMKRHIERADGNAGWGGGAEKLEFFEIQKLQCGIE